MARARTIRTRRQTNADLKVLAAATLGVVVAGLLIAAGIYAATSRGGSPTCGLLPLGSADAVRSELEDGPEFRTGGGRCHFLLALDDSGDIVAYKVAVPNRECTLRMAGNEFRCGDDVVDPADLARYPVIVETNDDIESIVIDLRSPDSKSTKR